MPGFSADSGQATHSAVMLEGVVGRAYFNFRMIGLPAHGSATINLAMLPK